MTHPCCPDCRLRFTRAAGAYLVACPECFQPLQPSSLKDTVGFGVFRPEDEPYRLPEAKIVALPVTEPGAPS
jgi:predicted amidophosphoribosyltransferase